MRSPEVSAGLGAGAQAMHRSRPALSLHGPFQEGRAVPARLHRLHRLYSCRSRSRELQRFHDTQLRALPAVPGSTAALGSRARGTRRLNHSNARPTEPRVGRFSRLVLRAYRTNYRGLLDSVLLA